MSIVLAKYGDQIISIREYGVEHKGKIHCSFCDEVLVAKKGLVKVHHFSHFSKKNCDSWYHKDHKSEWHLRWQNICKKEYLEKIIVKDEKKHIADIYNEALNLVIEIQNSNLDESEIKDRESFYNNMIWIVNLRNEWKPIGNMKCPVHVKEKDRSDLVFFGNNFLFIKTKKKFVTFMKKTTFIHIDDGLVKVIRCYDKGYILCEKVILEDFLKTYFSNILVSNIVDSGRVIVADEIYYNQGRNDMGKLDIQFRYLGSDVVLYGKGCKEISNSAKWSSPGRGLLNKLGFVFNGKYKNWSTKYKINEVEVYNKKDESNIIKKNENESDKANIIAAAKLFQEKAYGEINYNDLNYGVKEIGYNKPNEQRNISIKREEKIRWNKFLFSLLKRIDRIYNQKYEEKPIVTKKKYQNYIDKLLETDDVINLENGLIANSKKSVSVRNWIVK